MLLAFVGFVSSCENDDIEVTSFGSNVTFTISTQSVYDDFNISEQFKSRFLSDAYNIGVYTFMYDASGNLVEADSVFTKTFGKIEQSFEKIPVGDYTVITVEMLVNGDDDNKSESWVLVGQDKMSTLEIVNKNYVAYWYSAIGLSTMNVNITQGENQSYSIVPKGKGVIVDTRMTHFDKSDYRKITLFTKNQPCGRFLSPNFSGEDRFHYDKYLAEDTWSGRGYHRNKDGLSESHSPAIYLLEEGYIQYCFGAQKLDDNGGYSSSFYAFPDDTSNFLMRDGQTYYGGFCYIGGANPWSDCAAGMFNSMSELQKWYNNLSFYFNAPDAEPYLKWGASANEVTKYMQDCKMKFTYDGTNEDMYYSGWSNPDETLEYEYRFDTSKKNLNSLLMLYSSDAYSMENVFSDLKTKYVNEGYDSELGGYYFHTKNYETVLLLFENEGGFGVLYVGSTTSNAPKRVIPHPDVKSMLNLKSAMRIKHVKKNNRKNLTLW